jgi:hypothetical protein
MSATIRKRLWEPLLLSPSVLTKIYTAPEFVTTQIVVVNAHNWNFLIVTGLKFLIVKSGGSPTYSTDTLYSDILAQEQTAQYMQGMILNSGDMIYAIATGSSVAVNGFGIEITKGG